MSKYPEGFFNSGYENMGNIWAMHTEIYIRKNNKF